MRERGGDKSVGPLVRERERGEGGRGIIAMVWDETLGNVKAFKRKWFL